MAAIRCLLLCATMVLFIQVGEAEDAAGCKDSPLITRFPGAIIASCTDKPDDVGTFPMGSGKPDKKVEGEFHGVAYRVPSTVSKPQVVRNINTALHASGYTFDYDSGGYGDLTVHMGKT